MSQDNASPLVTHPLSGAIQYASHLVMICRHRLHMEAVAALSTGNHKRAELAVRVRKPLLDVVAWQCPEPLYEHPALAAQCVYPVLYEEDHSIGMLLVYALAALESSARALRHRAGTELPPEEEYLRQLAVQVDETRIAVALALSVCPGGYDVGR